jgi:hypothetical protein
MRVATCRRPRSGLLEVLASARVHGYPLAELACPLAASARTFCQLYSGYLGRFRAILPTSQFLFGTISEALPFRED